MRPSREKVESAGRTYFMTTQTAHRRALFRTDRWALLMQEVLEHYGSDSFCLHAYVIMPDHLHVLLSPLEALERSVQKIKGGFSFRARKGFDWRGEIWQAGFSDHGIRDAEDWRRHIEYIRQNPVKKGLVVCWEVYPYLQVSPNPIPQRLKPLSPAAFNGGAEAPPLQNAEVRRLQEAEIRSLQNAEVLPLQVIKARPLKDTEALSLQNADEREVAGSWVVSAAGALGVQHGSPEVGTATPCLESSVNSRSEI